MHKSGAPQSLSGRQILKAAGAVHPQLDTDKQFLTPTVSIVIHATAVSEHLMSGSEFRAMLPRSSFISSAPPASRPSPSLLAEAFLALYTRGMWTSSSAL